MKKQLLTIFSLVLLAVCGLHAQPIVLDEVVAVVGREIILKSDVESQVEQLVQQAGETPSEQLTCGVLEDLILQKLMLNQAYLDSVEVSDEEVESEVERRIQMFAAQTSGIAEMERLVGKSVEQIKEQSRVTVRKQILVDRIKSQVVADIKVTPAEVSKYFYSIPADSLPYIQGEVQIARISLKPPVQQVEIERVQQELLEYKKKIEAGRPFGIMAKFYSEDPGSKDNDGKLGLVRRSDLDPDFAAAAFALQEGEVSGVVKSQFGYHIIKLIAKKGEYADLQHILLVPKVLPEDLEASIEELMRIKDEIRTDSITFEEAARKYSQDEDTKNGGGIMMNMSDGSSWFSYGQLDVMIYENVIDLPLGGISKPMVNNNIGQETEVVMYYIVGRKEPHVASLKLDYQKLQMAALQTKQGDVILKWAINHQNICYVKIFERYNSCKFKVDWQQTAQ